MFKLKKGKTIAGLALVSVFFLTNASYTNLDFNKPDVETTKPGIAAQFDYKYTGQVKTGEDVMPLIGQLSKDGNRLYITSQDGYGSKKLVTMDRTGKNAFAAPETVEGKLAESGLDLVMPTLSGDELTMIFVNSVDGMQKGNDLYIASRDSKEEDFDNIRPLTEINTFGKSDSYPWISNDGNRIYFTKQRGGDITFWMAERENNKGEFNALDQLNISIDKVHNNLSCQLSPDEKDIFILNGDKIYYATRADKNKEFSVPVEIAQSSNTGFISGITMNEDASELFVFNSVGFRNTQILRFMNMATDNTPLIEVDNLD